MPGEIIPDTVTCEQLDQALEILVAFGKKRLCSTARDQASRGHCIGLAVASGTDAAACVDATEAMLEDWNGHLACAAVHAVEKEPCTVSRKGRTLTITLPPHWDGL